jgi:hypothetical protein
MMREVVPFIGAKSITEVRKRDIIEDCLSMTVRLVLAERRDLGSW